MVWSAAVADRVGNSGCSGIFLFTVRNRALRLRFFCWEKKRMKEYEEKERRSGAGQEYITEDSAQRQCSRKRSHSVAVTQELPHNLRISAIFCTGSPFRPSPNLHLVTHCPTTERSWASLLFCSTFHGKQDRTAGDSSMNRGCSSSRGQGSSLGSDGSHREKFNDERRKA